MSYEPLLGPEAILEGREAERELDHRRRPPQAAARE